MPKILRIINRLNLGGPTFNAALLTKHLQPEFNTLLLSGIKDDTEASSEHIVHDMGIEPVYIKGMYRSINPLRDLPAYLRIKKTIKEFKPDIVHTHAAKAGALGRLAAYDCKVPVIVHTFHGHVFHSYFGPLKTRFYLETERFLAKISDKIIAISPQQKNELSDIYKVCDKKKIKTIPLGFDLSRFQTDQLDKRLDFRKKYQVADDEVAIAIVGRLVPIKNHGLFLQALKEILDKSEQKIRAFIVGDGEERNRLENMARQLNIDFATPEQHTKAPLTFTSWVFNVDEVYAGVDVVALSSLNEGTPVSLIEAQAANKPIITTNVGGVCDIVKPNSTALIAESDNVQQFSYQLARLVEDATLRQRLGKNGNRHVAYQCSYQRLVKDMGDLYERLLLQKSQTYREQQLRLRIKNSNASLPHAGSSIVGKSFGGKVRAMYK